MFGCKHNLKAKLALAEAELAAANRKLVHYMEKSKILEQGHVLNGKKIARLEAKLDDARRWSYEGLKNAGRVNS